MEKQMDTFEGGCSCGHVRYKIISKPLIVHCCHCQRQSGAAFAVNALYEACKVNLISGKVDEIMTPSPSGNGQTIARCPQCSVALWSNYFMGGIKKGIRFIRVGTLDNPDRLPPDVHIYILSKQPWIVLPQGDLAVEEFYDYEVVWSPENQQLRQSLLAKAQAIGE